MNNIQYLEDDVFSDLRNLEHLWVIYHFLIPIYEQN